MKFMKKTAFAAVASLLLFSNCTKKAEPISDATTLTLEMAVSFGQYLQHYTKINDTLYELDESNAMFMLKQRGSFIEDSEAYGADSSIADTSKGEYNRALLLGPDTLVQQFKSPIAGELTTSEIRCEIEKIDSLSGSDTTFFTHSPTGQAELRVLYEDQILKEYKKVAHSMMWDAIYKQVDGVYSKEEADKRYSLIMNSKITKSTIPSSEIAVTDSTIKVYYEEPFMFILKFSGRVDINK